MRKNIDGTEKEVLVSISEWLSLNKIVHWRQNSGLMHIDNGLPKPWQKKRFVKFGFFCFPHGILTFLDLAGVYEGKFFSIECKRSGCKPSPAQLSTIRLITEQGGLAFSASSLDVVISAFVEFFNHSFIGSNG